MFVMDRGIFLYLYLPYLLPIDGMPVGDRCIIYYLFTFLFLYL
ncbi:hypothetical protein HMPREF0663_10476 [Hoylesella oralis ATCC 33269]|uniref:Uncharacterized protein n=1 Tax=Hoylesella oralis ATCC 33269 TaxID=873533 RepID=E7RMX6_9BACT|nr:hypothetical protein HMPREF0663_10476 [Hoylesella oralis ATCC 33269]